MQKKKRSHGILFCILLSLFVLFSFSGCKDKKPPSDTQGTQSTAESTQKAEPSGTEEVTDPPVTGDTSDTTTSPETDDIGSSEPPSSTDTPSTSNDPDTDDEVSSDSPESSTSPESSSTPETSTEPDTSTGTGTDDPEPMDEPIQAEEYEKTETLPDCPTLPDNTERVEIVQSNVIISDKILVEYIKGGGRLSFDFPNPILLETDDGYEFYDLSKDKPEKCDSIHVKQAVEFDGISYHVDFLYCIVGNKISLINYDCESFPPDGMFMSAPSAIAGRTDAVVLNIYSSGEQYSEYPLLFSLSDYSVQDILFDSSFEFVYPDNEITPPPIPDTGDGSGTGDSPDPTLPDMGSGSASLHDTPEQDSQTGNSDDTDDMEGSDNETDPNPSNEPITPTSVIFNSSLQCAVIRDENADKVYLLNLKNDTLIEFPYGSYMHYFIDDTHVFYIITEYEGEDAITDGYCLDTETGISAHTLKHDANEKTEPRFIKDAAYAIIVYTERESQAAVVNLLSGEKLTISGYRFKDDTTVTVNSSMTHLLFSNTNDNFITEDLAILCLESKSFKVLKIEGECERFEIGTHFVSDNKIAIFSYLNEDPDHFYISLYTFEDFLTVEDEHNKPTEQ